MSQSPTTATVEHGGDGSAVAVHRPEALACISTPIPSHKIAEQPQSLSRIWYLLGLPFVLGIALFLTQSDPALVLMREGWLIFTLFAAVYTASWGLAAGFERFPSVPRSDTAVFALCVGLIPSGGALLFSSVYHPPYFVTAAALLCVGWFLGSIFLFGSRTRSHLAVIPGGAARALLETSKVKNNGQVKAAVGESVNGVAADLHQPTLNGYQGMLARNSLLGLPVYHAAYIYELLSGRVHLASTCDISAGGRAPGPLYPWIKRGMDVTLVILSLPVTIPLMLLTSLAIWVESPGPVLFTQDRIGKDGRSFRMIKFRSMSLDAEKNGARFAGEKDPRVTRVGKFIRKFRIDELPQFWNVIRGDMSLIGPRPEQVHFVQRFNEEIPHYACRHAVCPGITGWAQVRAGYAADTKETRHKLSYDLYYVKHRSFVLDVLIVCLTVKTMLTGFGAR